MLKPIILLFSVASSGCLSDPVFVLDSDDGPEISTSSDPTVPPASAADRPAEVSGAASSDDGGAPPPAPAEPTASNEPPAEKADAGGGNGGGKGKGKGKGGNED